MRLLYAPGVSESDARIWAFRDCERNGTRKVGKLVEVDEVEVCSPCPRRKCNRGGIAGVMLDIIEGSIEALQVETKSRKMPRLSPGRAAEILRLGRRKWEATAPGDLAQDRGDLMDLHQSLVVSQCLYDTIYRLAHGWARQMNFRIMSQQIR